MADTPQPPQIMEACVIYTQDGDADHPGIQQLTVEAIDAGGGPYLVLSTERWSIDSPAELLPLLERVQRMVEPSGENRTKD